MDRQDCVATAGNAEEGFQKAAGVLYEQFRR